MEPKPKEPEIKVSLGTYQLHRKLLQIYEKVEADCKQITSGDDSEIQIQKVAQAESLVNQVLQFARSTLQQ